MLDLPIMGIPTLTINQSWIVKENRDEHYA